MNVRKDWTAVSRSASTLVALSPVLATMGSLWTPTNDPATKIPINLRKIHAEADSQLLVEPSSHQAGPGATLSKTSGASGSSIFLTMVL